MANTLVTHLECSLCNKKFQAGKVMEPVRVRRTSAGPLRSGRPSRNMVARQLRVRAGFDVALRARAARPIRELQLSHSGKG